MASAQQKVLSKTLKGEGVYLALGTGKAPRPFMTGRKRSAGAVWQSNRKDGGATAAVDKWRVYADKHTLPENKPMDASALNK